MVTTRSDDNKLTMEGSLGARRRPPSLKKALGGYGDERRRRTTVEARIGLRNHRSSATPRWSKVKNLGRIRQRRAMDVKAAAPHCFATPPDLLGGPRGTRHRDP